MGADRPVALIVANEVNGTVTSRNVQYLHDGRLGSLDTVTNSASTVNERARFDPFGGRRDPARLADPTPAPFGIPNATDSPDMGPTTILGITTWEAGSMTRSPAGSSPPIQSSADR